MKHQPALPYQQIHAFVQDLRREETSVPVSVESGRPTWSAICSIELSSKPNIGDIPRFSNLFVTHLYDRS